MDREYVKKILPIMQAFADGKTIEMLCFKDKWKEVDEPYFNLTPNCYRVKPEPKYRAFNTKEECWNEMHEHPDFGWIKRNVTGEYKQIVRIFDYCKTELSFNIAYNGDDDYSSEMMLNSYTFTDGTPFGVKIEDVWKNEQKN